MNLDGLVILDAIRREVDAAPNHQAGGYDWEWDCRYRFETRDRFPDCAVDEPEHADELISRERVLAILDRVENVLTGGTETRAIVPRGLDMRSNDR